MLSTLTSIYAPMYAPRLTARVSALLKDRKGVSAMEYAVLAVAIVVAVGVGAAAVSTAFKSTMTSVAGDL